MKKILLSIFGIITLGLVNFGYCVDSINPGDSFSISSPASFYADSDLIVCAEGGGGNFAYMGSSTNFNGFPAVCIIVPYGNTFTINVWGTTSINGYYVNCPSSSCSQCEDDLYICQNSLYNANSDLSYCQSSLNSCNTDFNNLKSSYNTLSGNYNICTNNLSLCQSDFSDCVLGYDTVYNSLNACQSSLSTATGNLATCQSDLSNCQNSSSCDYSGYILESEINSGYCLVNGLCPSSEICNDSDYSNLFIYSNNRYFPITGTNNIYVNLPSYLGYDYDYSNGGNDLDIAVGYVIDTGYIENINNQQSYIPTTDDFTNVFGNIGTFGALLVVCLFVILVFYMIKKIFS